MKKITSIILVVLLLLSTIALVSCNKEDTLKMGLGIEAEISEVKNADGDANGKVKIAQTVASVLLNKDQKVVKCVLDAIDVTVETTSEGAFVAPQEFKTKHELKDAYNMVAYGGAKSEWYVQAKSFADLVAGKSLAEIKALVAEGDRGTDEVINAGCTIMIADFVKAIEKAFANATDTKATDSCTLKLGVSVAHSAKNAADEAAGQHKVDTSFAASAVDADGKVVAIAVDDTTSTLKFDATGAFTAEKGALTSKKAQGDKYGMAQYGQDLNGDGTVKEWHAQAAEFEKACVGKTASEISALVTEKGYGVDDLQKAGCTIAISNMVKAVVKSATVG